MHSGKCLTFLKKKICTNYKCISMVPSYLYTIYIYLISYSSQISSQNKMYIKIYYTPNVNISSKYNIIVSEFFQWICKKCTDCLEQLNHRNLQFYQIINVNDNIFNLNLMTSFNFNVIINLRFDVIIRCAAL